MRPCQILSANSGTYGAKLYQFWLAILFVKKKLLYCRQIREFQLLNARLRNLAMQRKPMHF